jgi:hypothetical protein
VDFIGIILARRGFQLTSVDNWQGIVSQGLQQTIANSMGGNFFLAKVFILYILYGQPQTYQMCRKSIVVSGFIFLSQIKDSQSIGHVAGFWP